MTDKNSESDHHTELLHHILSGSANRQGKENEDEASDQSPSASSTSGSSHDASGTTPIPAPILGKHIENVYLDGDRVIVHYQEPDRTNNGHGIYVCTVEDGDITKCINIGNVDDRLPPVEPPDE